VGPGAGLDRCGKSRPTGIRSSDLYRLSYPGYYSWYIIKKYGDGISQMVVHKYRGRGKWVLLNGVNGTD
jgi:hypothetical protein